MLRPFAKKEKEVGILPVDDFEESEELKPTIRITAPKAAKKPEPEPEEEVETETETVDQGEVISAIEYHLNKAYQLLQAFK